MLPGKMMIPLVMDFSSRMLSSLKEMRSPREPGRHFILLPHCLHADTPLIREEDENLVGGILLRVGEKIELVSAT